MRRREASADETRGRDAAADRLEDEGLGPSTLRIMPEPVEQRTRDLRTLKRGDLGSSDHQQCCGGKGHSCWEGRNQWVVDALRRALGRSISPRGLRELAG